MIRQKKDLSDENLNKVEKSGTITNPELCRKIPSNSS
jgi:hypothetical protein